MIPILQMGTLKLGESKWFAWVLELVSDLAGIQIQAI